MSWRMTRCQDGDSPLEERTFGTLEDGEAWLRENHPGYFARGVWKSERADTFMQWGEGYYWASFTRVPS